PSLSNSREKSERRKCTVRQARRRKPAADSHRPAPPSGLDTESRSVKYYLYTLLERSSDPNDARCSLWLARLVRTGFRLRNLAPPPCHSSTVARGRGSPQNRLQRSVGSALGPSRLRLRMCAATDGTENQTVSLFLLTNPVGARSSMGDMA